MLTGTGLALSRYFRTWKIVMLKPNGILFFLNNNYQLWRSDGTSSGTLKIADLQPNHYVTYSTFSLTSSNGLLFFSQCDNDDGCELWKSDGTEAGTVLVKDINSRPNKSSHPFNLTNVNGKLFFYLLLKR